MRVLAATIVAAICLATTGGAGAAPVGAAAIGQAVDAVSHTVQAQYRAGHYRGRGMTIRQQIARDRYQQSRARWRTLYDTQVKVFEETQRVTINRARNADRANRAWQRYLNR